MNTRRLPAFLLAVTLLLTCFVLPTAAAGSLTLALTDDVEEGEALKLGDTVTYTATITGNEKGFLLGTFFFRPSENLEYESATCLGEPLAEDALVEAVTGENAGAFGVVFLRTENYTETDTVLCTMTFRVINVGDVSVELYSNDLIGLDEGIENVTVQVTGNGVTRPVATPEAPTVLTETLDVATKDKAYSAVLKADAEEFVTWAITDGSLPAGLELLNDGTIAGTPTEFGEFPIQVTVTLLDDFVSQPKELVLTVREKPLKLELKEDSSYVATEDGYLKKVVAETSLATLLSQLAETENVKVFRADGTAVTDETALVGTGCTVSLMDGEEAVHTLTVVVLGDVDGNGIIGTLDYQRVRAYYSGNYQLTGANLEAARVTGREEIGTLDYQRIRAHFIGNFNLYA